MSLLHLANYETHSYSILLATEVHVS